MGECWLMIMKVGGRAGGTGRSRRSARKTFEDLAGEEGETRVDGGGFVFFGGVTGERLGGHSDTVAGGAQFLFVR